MPKPYDLTTHDGKRVDWLTKSFLLAMEERLGYELTIVQGSYNAGGVSQSAGTHDGGGVVDLAPFDAARKVRVARALGGAAWRRMPSQGDWSEHVHIVLVGNEKLSSSAASQVSAYLTGRNGLRNGAPDDGPREFVDRRWRWPYASRVDRARQILRALRLIKGAS